MALMRRLQDDFDWPEWLSSRWMFEPTEGWFRGLGSNQMHIEEFQQNGELIVRAELAGVDPDKDLEVTQSDGTLWIRAERHKSATSETARNWRSEFHYGSLVRGVPLPRRADSSGIVASYADGVLEVRIPMNGAAETGHRIPIKHQ
jgi:HSP20 family protein